MFETKQGESFPDREEAVLDFWQKNKIFEKSLEMRKNGPLFSFYDGPPFATGLPHYGHLLAGTIKDVVPRYKTMKGYFVPRRFGWDCHGLPVENEIEKEQKLFGALAIEEFGIAKFNQECAKIVLRYTSEWKKTVDRMGRWVDFSLAYKTMDRDFMESVWWVFQELFKKGLVYEGFKVMPFSAQLGTPLSNFEANLNYKDVDDPSLVVLFPALEEENTYFLAWTTTPWTLVSNLALTAKKDLDYVKILDSKTKKKYILAKSRLPVFFPDPKTFQVLETFDGKSLEGKRYKPIFPHFSEKSKEGAFRVILAEFVSTEEGTGIVHTAPAFGEDDFFACKEANVPVVCPVDQNGRFTKEVPEYQGLFVKDADKQIIRRLKENDLLFSQGQIHHRYPFCWRSDTPLIYKAVQTWFVSVEKIKDLLVSENQKIHWVPEHIRDGRFGKWLENARDWAISRNRYWGTPIPIWRAEDGELLVIGSVAELEKLTGKKVSDIHRQFIDDLTIEKGNKTFKRISEVFDCWFESGSMPYAQNHYPFEHKKETEKAFPADFIAEGLDQTRGWFYTLCVLSVALFQKAPFKNVIVNGIILAADGTKMSKRLKNYPEPEKIIHQMGADAIRLYLMGSPVVQAEDLNFSQSGVELVLRQVLIPLWNAFSFLSTYAKIYHWEPSKKVKHEPKASLDQWMLSLVQSLILKVETSMEKFQLNQAVEPLVEFVDQLTNWYIRRSRGRFWADDESQDRNEAFSTLYEVLLSVVKISAPFIPFLSESIYLELKTKEMPESVHLTDFPLVDKKKQKLFLEKEMAFVQKVVKIGHSLRKEQKLKVRQPLAAAHIATTSEEMFSCLEKQKQLIADELNVKEVQIHRDESKFVRLKAKPNFRVLGKKVGKLLPEVQKHIEQKFGQKELKELLSGVSISITMQDQEIKILPEDVAVEREILEGIFAANEGELTVALDTHLTEELLLEGLSRELVNKINTMRRDLGFEVTDRISVKLDTTQRVHVAFEKHKDYICNEVLATKIVFEKAPQGMEWDLNGERAVLEISKVNK